MSVGQTNDWYLELVADATAQPAGRMGLVTYATAQTAMKRAQQGEGMDGIFPTHCADEVRIGGVAKLSGAQSRSRGKVMVLRQGVCVQVR